MTDAELLKTAANRISFVVVAQRVLVEELHRRGLTSAPPSAPPMPHSAIWNWSHRLADRIHHHSART
jgi:hypothetical protein